MDDELVIETGIPAPTRGIGRPSSAVTRALNKLEVAQSVVVPKSVGASLSAYFSKRKPKRFVRRTLENGDIRVWRIE